MDKAEYQQRLDELTALVEEKDFKGALEIADSIDWRRVKSVKTLTMVADIYEYNRRPEKEKEILAIAQSRTSIGRGILARLVEVCLQLGQVEQAEKYFRDFSKVAQNDNTRYVLQYQLYKAKRAPLEAQIAVLEEYREREYTEQWAYELAELYAKAGEQEKCVEACDDLILWFSEGKYVLKAMELKKQYGPLSEKQQEIYSRERDAENERARQAAAARAAEEAAARERAAKAEAEAKAREEAEAAAREKAEAEASEAESDTDITEEGSEEFPEPTEEDSEESLAEASEEYDGPKLPIGEIRPAAPIDRDLLDEEAEEAEEEAEYIAKTTEKKKGEPSDLKHRLLRSFHSMFGGTADEEEFPEDIEEEKVPEKIRAKKKEWPFKKKEAVIEEPAEEDLTIRELVPDSEVIPQESVISEAEPVEKPEEMGLDEQPTKEIISDAVPVPKEEKKPEIEFDLESFLKETAGSFSDEIETGEFKVTTEEAPIRLDEDINTPEEEAAKKAAMAFGMEELTSAGSLTNEKSIQAVINGVEPIEEIRAVETVKKPAEASVEPSEGKVSEPAEIPVQPERKQPHYIEELEIPDPEPTPEEKKSHTIPLGTIGQNTVPISIDKILSEESPEEQRIRILNKTKPTRMNEDQRRVFTYFARIPGMDSQILEALSGVYEHAGERTSLHGNIGVMGAKGTGKSRLSQGLVITMCKDLDLKVAKIARITGEELNKKDPAKVVSIMSGGFLTIEDISKISDATLEKLNQAMEFRTDCMIVIIEDEKTAMRAFLKSHPVFATKFDKLISIPVFTNDELVTFARTYAAENGYQLDDLGILALYTKIGNKQSEEKPVTISEVKELVDGAIDHASKGRRRGKRGKDSARMQILHEKDFE